MRAKRGGQAAKIRRRRWGVVALVLAGLALCLLAALPVQAARNTKKYCFPLDTAVWRVSDVYGKRIDPFTGKAAFHQGLDLACAAGTAVRAVPGGGGGEGGGRGGKEGRGWGGAGRFIKKTTQHENVH